MSVPWSKGSEPTGETVGNTGRFPKVICIRFSLQSIKTSKVFAKCRALALAELLRDQGIPDLMAVDPRSVNEIQVQKTIY